MRIENVYENAYILPVYVAEKFVESKKQELNDVERVGLESIAVEFLCQNLASSLGQRAVTASARQTFRDLLSWEDDCVTLLDGRYNTYEVDGLLIEDVWMTENGIPMMTAYEIPDGDDWTEHDFRTEYKKRFIRLD